MSTFYSMPDGSQTTDYAKAMAAYNQADQSGKLAARGGVAEYGPSANNSVKQATASAGNFGLQTAANSAATVADPWASQRGQYQTSLSQLVSNPGAAMQNNPFFKWQQDQGLQAVNRTAAANGNLGAGNRMMALSDYAQKQSGQNFFQLADLYSLLGGAKNQNPASAAQLQYKGAQDTANIAMKQQALQQQQYENDQSLMSDSRARLAKQPDVNPYAGYSFGGFSAT